MRLRVSDNKGFTLVEILVVLALTMLVMGLIFGPLIQSYKITRRAEVIIRAQDNARFALAQISADLANAMYVYDNTRDPVNFPVLAANDDANGERVVVQLYYAKVDLVLPRMRGYCPVDSSHTPGGVQRGDPARPNVPEDAAPACPTCGALLELTPVEPLVQDTRIVRYFIGLKDNVGVDVTKPAEAEKWYYNGYERYVLKGGKLKGMPAMAGEDNTYVLYRAEFAPFNDRLFEDADPAHFNQNLSDENFFYNQASNGYGETYAEAWRKISRPVVTLEDIDLITVEYDGAGNPVVSPTVRFAPTAIYNDPLVPTTETSDDPEHGDVPPTMYKATYGHWVLPYAVILEPPGGGGTITYESMQGLGLGAQDPASDVCVYKVDRSASPPSYELAFNITYYLDTKSASAYGVGDIWPLDLAARQRAFVVDTRKGTVNFALPNVYQAYCETLNLRVSSQVGGAMALSEVANTADVNNDPYRRLLMNWYDAAAGGSDPRVLSNATVVPGSVRITAANARQGPSFGALVPYTRAAFLSQDPGANQFSVDAGHNEPAPGVAAVYFHMPRTAQPGSGWTLPDGVDNVLVYYEVQNNKKGDVLRANYLTKSVMTVILGIRIYDPSSGKLQSIQVTNKIRIGNIAP